MSAVATNRLHGSTAATEILVLEPVAQRLGLAPILLVPGELTIGSSPECQIQLTVPGVQPQHCVINSSRSRVSLRALDHRTWHNNLPSSEGWLRVGDRLAIGPVEFRVRRAEPWDVLPPVSESIDSSEPASIARAVVQQPSEQDRVKSFESQLLQQIANLEAEVGRHQAAVAKLEQHVQAEPVPVVVPATRPLLAVDAAPMPAKLVSQHEFTVPRFHLSPAITRTLNDEHDRLRTELEAYHHQARKQLAELSVRNEALNRQCLELAAQWDQLRELIAEQEAATVERGQREQQLYERERRCSFQESEITRRSQRLAEELDKVAARLLQLQAESDQLAGQSADLTEREQRLAELSRRLDSRELEIGQAHTALEQREAACRNAEDAGASWYQLRETTESRWAQRAEELEKITGHQQAVAEELKSRERACEQLAAEIRHDRQQLQADRAHLEDWNHELSQLQTDVTQKQQELETLQRSLQSVEGELGLREAECHQSATSVRQDRDHLAAEQVRLEAWNQELTQSQEVFNQQQQELAIEASSLKAEAQEFVLREYAWEQIVSTTQRDQERLAAEQDRLEALRSDFTARQSELTERQQELEARASAIESDAEELIRRELSINQVAAAVQQDQDRLVAEQQRLETWSDELSVRQSQLAEEQQEIATQSANWTSQIEELRERKQTWEQTVTATEQAEEELLSERYRLEAWHDELSAQQAALTRELEELRATQAEWEETRRSEADALANASTNDYSNLERMREEFVFAESELENVEADLNDFEAELKERAEKLAARESALFQAEIECAWQQRESELDATRNQPTSDDVSMDEFANVSVSLSDERDMLAAELFAAAQPLAASDDAPDQLLLETERLARDVEACQQRRQLLDAERLAMETSRHELQEQQRAWQAERRLLESALESVQSQLAGENESLKSELAALRSREGQLENQWQELNAERASLDQASHDLRQQQAGLAQRTQGLERQEQELTALREQQSDATESQQADTSARDREIDAAQAALYQQREELKAAKRQLDRERAAWEEDRKAWEEQLASESRLETSDSPSSNAMDVLSRLDEMVQSELDRDAQLELDADTSDPFEAIRNQYGVSSSELNRNELQDENEHEVHEAPRSLWAADAQDETRSETDSTADLPATEEDLSVLNLRARLAEMFSLELSESSPEAVIEDPRLQPSNESDVVESPYEESTEAEEPVPETTYYQAPQEQIPRAVFAEEPVADEYDSVESYMQRLLDRNRKSRASEEPAPDRYISNSTAPPAKTSNQPPQPQAKSEFDESASEPYAKPEPVPEFVRVPSIRGPVDTRKMRAGLDSLRQVANISARHAIARSKWKKMRTRVALQSMLTGGAAFVGLSILTGKWLGLIGTNLWGWLALGIAVALGGKVSMDIRWIYQGERRRERSMDAPSESDTTPASEVSASDEPEAETLTPEL
ncbi:MAG: hypothetical protein JWN70_3712 [Planctomycetaceae bacterium]|nr:hypothetical protein [Planctomycetaceae bacterium]